MKMKSFIGALALVSQLAFAAPVPTAELGKVNSFITTLLGEMSDSVKIQFTKAERSDDGKKIVATTVTLDSQDLVKVSVDAKIAGGDFNLAGKMEADISKQEIDENRIAEMRAKLEDAVDQMNAAGEYKATLDIKEVGALKTLTLKAEKIAATATLKKLNLVVTYPKDFKSGKVKADLQSTFDTKDANVVRAQDAASNIFNAAAKGQEPAQQDFQTLVELFTELMNYVQI